MPFSFVVNDMRALINAITTLTMVEHMVDATFSPEMFCLIADSYIFTDTAAIGLQLWPPFFDHYFCNKLQRSWFLLNKSFSLALKLQHSGYTSLTFSVPNSERAQLNFQGPNGLLREIPLELGFTDDLMYIGKFDLSVFVTMDSQQFSRLVAGYHRFDYVHVTVTSSQMIFIFAIMEQTVLTTRNGGCIIGGLKAPNQIQFTISLRPAKAFYDMVRQTKRIWIFKLCNSTKGLITAPLGLNGRFVAFLVKT